MKNPTERFNLAGKDPLEILRLCGGYYDCPKSSDGRRIGPLVGYAGKYEAADGTKKQWVGDTYANFARAEEFSYVLAHFAHRMPIISVIDKVNVFCGAPIGGYSFSQILGFIFDRRVIKAEKKITTLATADFREESTLVFGRHNVEKGDRVAIVEDVCNNFSTAEKLISLIEGVGGYVVAIICLLNRSSEFKDFYYPNQSDKKPIKALVRKFIPQYKQDDPEVADDIARGNIVWKPKNDWDVLMATQSGL